MSNNDDELIDNFASDDANLDINMACYAISDSLAYDQEASFLCLNLKTIAKLRKVKGLDSKKIGTALFECFKQPEMESELAGLRTGQKQIALVQAKSRETGVDLSDDTTAKIPASIREELGKLGLCFDIVPQRPPVSRLFDNEFTGELH